MIVAESGSNIQFRLMKNSDLDRVIEVERAGYPIPWSRAVFEDCFKEKNECWVLELEGVLYGYAIISMVMDEAHLLNLCIDPKCGRRGLGRALLKRMIDRAIDLRSVVFFLEVRASNKFAINLYFSEGFNEVGIRPNYYPTQEGREDAVLMTLELSVDLRI